MGKKESFTHYYQLSIAVPIKHLCDFMIFHVSKISTFLGCRGPASLLPQVSLKASGEFAQHEPASGIIWLPAAHRTSKKDQYQ